MMSLAEIEAVDLAWARSRRETAREMATLFQLSIASALGSSDATDLLREI